MKKEISLLLLLASAAVSSAEPFQNLGFDDADLSKLFPSPNAPAGAGALSDLLPGWQLSLGSNQLAGILYNQLDTEVTPPPNVSLLSQSFPQETVYPPGVKFTIDGQLALVIAENPYKEEHFNLRQTGDVPSNTKFLAFSYAGSPLTVSINGNVIGSTFPFGGAPTTTESFDVSKYAGQNVTLSFDGIGDPIAHTGGSYFLDKISFQVPEPGTGTLFGLGGCALLVAGLRRRR